MGAFGTLGALDFGPNLVLQKISPDLIMGPVFKASNGRHRKFESLNYFLINFTSPGTVLGYLKFNTKECLSIFDSFKKLLLLLLFMFC